MPYSDKQPHWGSMDHPLRNVLRQMAANGQTPSQDDLATIPGYGTSARVRQDIDDAVRKATRLHNSGMHAAAVEAADSAAHRIGPDLERYPMPEDRRPVEDVADIGARMFRH